MGSRRILFIYNPRLIDVLQGARWMQTSTIAT
jgi:hypothetical protein